MNVIDNNIECLMNPRSIALIGCSENNMTGIALKNMLQAGYQGDIFPIHPKNTEVHGVRCYGSLMEIPTSVDACVVGLRGTLLPGIIEEMKGKGVKAAILYASGFSEIGEDGLALQRHVTTLLQDAGIAACGPNCLGLINLHSAATMYGADCDIREIVGKIGVVSHSGAVCVALASSPKTAGYSYLISCGSEAVVTMADYIKYMLHDKNTEVIFCFMETIRDAEGLKEAGALSRKLNKPVVILKTGKSVEAREVAMAHSGALASDSDLSDTFLKSNGFLLVDSIDEATEFCELFTYFSGYAKPRNAKIALTAISGGQLGFCSDVVKEVGLEFAKISPHTIDKISRVLPDFATAKNPLDVTTALFDVPAYKECLFALAGEESVDMVIACQDAEHKMCDDEVRLYKDIMKGLGEAGSEMDKPFFVFSPLSGGLHEELVNILKESNVPLLQGTHQSLRAAQLYFEWHKDSNEKDPSYRPGKKIDKIKRTCARNSNYLSEAESKRLLAEYGIETTVEVLTGTVEEAVKAASQIGYPVVMKLDSPDIPHKTEAGVVKLNIPDEASVRRSFEIIHNNAMKYDDKAHINGISVQEMVVGGHEIILGIKNDPILGPAVLVGLGGIFVEVFEDYALQMAPISKQQALEMIDSLRGSKLLKGFRKGSIADIEALADTLVRLSILAYDYRKEIAELDVNPLIVFEEGKGVKAVDALIITY